MPARIAIDEQQIAEFCQRRRIKSLALFGSVLRDDFRPESDVDVLIELAPEAHISLSGFVRVQAELSALLGREAHLVDKRSLRNPFRRRAIMETAEEVYAA